MARRTTQQLSVDELRTQISQRLRSNAAFSKTVYQEQPIIMTGSQLKSFVPDAIREARQLAKQGYARNLSVVDVFYEQARLLAGYEDDFEFTGTFSHYYPSYEDMSNEQLRGYFAWRTKVRHGNIEQGSLSFAYVYLYELINLIGVSSAQDAYDTLLAFGTAYRRFDTRFGQLFDIWLDDFVIYYGLDAGLLRTPTGLPPSITPSSRPRYPPSLPDASRTNASGCSSGPSSPTHSTLQAPSTRSAPTTPSIVGAQPGSARATIISNTPSPGSSSCSKPASAPYAMPTHTPTRSSASSPPSTCSRPSRRGQVSSPRRRACARSGPCTSTFRSSTTSGLLPR